jgi:DNA-binding GntR family transcriptional regulator
MILTSGVLDDHEGSQVAPTERITLTSVADEIAFRLEVEILEGVYPPGSHLMQKVICERFGVSRTPVREALRKLQAQNLVDLIPNQGARIRALTLTELSEVYAVRAELEGFAAALAADVIDRDQVARLELIQAEMETVVADLFLPADERVGDSAINAQITRINEDFHGAIRSAAGNGLLDRMINDLQKHFPKDYVWRTIRSASEVKAIHVGEHRRILRALKRGDAAAARSEMCGHVNHAGAILLSYLHERGAAS